LTPTVALTFDDGPSEWTEPLLDLLAANGARATFFVIGSLAEQRPDVVRRIDAEGHEIGNHTWSHPWLARDCDDGRVHDELGRTNAFLEQLLGKPPRRFRAPHYDVDARVEAVAATLGLAHTRGDVTPPDWQAGAKGAYLATYVLQRGEHGLVIGLHDGSPPAGSSAGASREPTVAAAAAFLPRFRERGVECVSASELLDARP
jgi:peptidoglycan-N-acetylglucosamine deacetylase